MTTARLAAIQRDLGLHPTVVGKPGRPGTFQPVAVAAHWTAVRSGPGNRAPALAIVRDGRAGLPGPLYGDLIPWQDDPGRLEVIQITVGRSNNLGMCHRPTVLAAGQGAILPRRPPADTGGGNHLVDAVSADYHPAQGPPPAAMVEAFVRAIAARLIYRGLPAHAVLDHAQATRRKIDLLDHWPQLTELRARVAAAMHPTSHTEEDDPMRLVQDDQGRIYAVAGVSRAYINDPATVSWLLQNGHAAGGVQRIPTSVLRDAYPIEATDPQAATH